jgi:hypothetical protein
MRLSASPCPAMGQRWGRGIDCSATYSSQTTWPTIGASHSSGLVRRVAYHTAACKTVAPRALGLGLDPVGAPSDVNYERHREFGGMLHLRSKQIPRGLKLVRRGLHNELIVDLEDHPAAHPA